MAETSPFIIYFEGEPQSGDTLYRYVPIDVSLKITGYRILSRDGVAIDLNLYKNGNLLDVVNATGSIYENLSIPPLYFYSNDTLTITCASAPAQPLTGLTIIFFCEVSDSIDTSASANIKRIQTPLITRYEGILTQGESFLYYVPSQRIEVFNYQVALRNSADQDLILDLKRNNVTISQIFLTAGQLYQEGMIDVFFESGDVISLTINQCGTNALPGESLILFLDYRNTTQTEFSDFQVPFVVEYEGLDVPESNSIFNYHCPRDLTVANVQVFLREAIAADLQVGLYHTGQIISSFVLTAGNTDTAPSVVEFPFVSGDYLRLAVISPASLSSALIATVDYFIEAEGDDSAAFRFYSDPQSDIVILARQVGFGGAKADAISFDNLLKYQHLVDDIINGRLRTTYRVPLLQVTEVGTKINPWPGAIQSLAQRLVLRYLLNDTYSEVEPNISSNVEKQALLANEDLEMIIERKVLLEGQKYRVGNYGSNPYTEPLAPNTPPAPPPFQVTTGST